ncbi:MAG: hypothetical protein U9N81_02370 [Bacillota bacterium]|nr:hypothetical protein [Bacillota bacterium]
MLQLDFAYLHMMNSKRQGLAGRKFFLDRLAPSFYAPRVERLISFADLLFKGCNVFLPLGEANWTMLDPERRDQVMHRGEQLLADFSLSEMAVDRRLKPLFQSVDYADQLCFGDDFVKALAVVLTRETLKRFPVQRLIVVGTVPGMEEFIEYLTLFDTPITLQNFQPGRYEIMVYRLLYEKGLAVSNNSIQSRNWSSGDLVLTFEPTVYPFALSVPDLFFFGLHNDGHGMAPVLENVIATSGLDAGLHTLAPIFESCLYRKAGFNKSDRELNLSSKKGTTKRQFEVLIQAGDQVGLWEPFLDKGI